MEANNSLRINMPRALELISFFPRSWSDLSGSAITRGNCSHIMHLINIYTAWKVILLQEKPIFNIIYFRFETPVVKNN